ncbi:MAG: CotH kinase family protein [Paludibacteraceae bacterium]|nr:CotH kinase family protein [Paludibacteraceae bacterium]
MKKLLLVTLAVFAALSCFALNIPKGTIYYDNSVTKFKEVKFSYGYRDEVGTVLVTMKHEGDNIWSYNVPAKVEDVYRYIFLETKLSDGIYDSTFPDFKDMIVQRGEIRTATTDKTICTGCVFVPVDNLEKNWYQGSWVKPSDDEDDTEKPAVPELPKANCDPHSATVPVFYLNTENKAPIESKEEYVSGSLYIDALDNEGYVSSGSKASPLVTEVKGRGNYTWIGFDKKPYRIKMDKKASLLNMTTDKSYTLLAHADDNYGFLRNTAGFALSRFFELGYTPTAEPVELFLNGEYRGLYFLTDHIKVSSNRVKIEEQDDLETDPEKVTGGWLLEIDNYEDDPHITIYKKDEYGSPMWFTYKSPEELSYQQEAYITNFLNLANDAVYAEDKSSTEWEKYIDMDSLVNYYLVYEILANREGFHGSCYLHKERGENTKLIFGPVWDFGNTLWNMNNTFIHEDWSYGVKWIDQIAQFPRFQNAVRKRWLEKRGSLMPYLRAEVDAFIDKITMASQCDCQKWPEYGNANVLERKQAFYDILSARLAWLDTQFGTVDVTEEQALQVSVYPNPTRGDINIASESAVSDVTLSDLSGKVLQTFQDTSSTLHLNVQPGTYLLHVTTAEGVQIRKIIVY